MEVNMFLAAMKRADKSAARQAFDLIDAQGLWKEALSAARQLESIHPNASDEFHAHWTERGFRVREVVADDALLLDALRNLLPAYKGPSLGLYRGENLDKWLARRIGFGWTPEKEPATTFACGLAATEGAGGVLLFAEVPASRNNFRAIGPQPLPARIRAHCRCSPHRRR